METATGNDREGYPPKHFAGAAGATTENGKHMRREYDKVESEALERGQTSAEPAAVEDGHGATTHGAGQTQDEGGHEKPRRARATQDETYGKETEERGSPERSPAPNAGGCRGREG